MLKLKTIAAIIAVLLSMSISILAQTQAPSQTPPHFQIEPKAMELLKKVAESYRNIKSYQLEGVEVWENRSTGMYNRTESAFVWAFEKSGKFRLETKSPVGNRSTTVSNGESIWSYNPNLKQYTKKSVQPLPKAGDPDIGARRIPNPLDKIGGTKITDLARGARIMPEEVISIDGKSINCYVVEVIYRAPRNSGDINAPVIVTYWIDKTRFIVIRKMTKQEVIFRPSDERTETKGLITFSLAKVDESLPASLFGFIPPEGIKEVAEFVYDNGYIPTKLTGKQALPFALKDRDGKLFEFEGTRGKTVLLNFWSITCGPCIKELPVIEKIHREFKDKGLVVLTINSSEGPEAIGEFLKDKDYTFTVLIDEDLDAANKYQALGIPQTYVVDRQRNIVAHLIAYNTNTEGELYKAIEKALSDSKQSNKPSNSSDDK
jgi:outer membrane lipoprotein-sorting protein/peroxiredoxin